MSRAATVAACRRPTPRRSVGGSSVRASSSRWRSRRRSARSGSSRDRSTSGSNFGPGRTPDAAELASLVGEVRAREAHALVAGALAVESDEAIELARGADGRGDAGVDGDARGPPARPATAAAARRGRDGGRVVARRRIGALRDARRRRGPPRRRRARTVARARRRRGPRVRRVRSGRPRRRRRRRRHARVFGGDGRVLAVLRGAGDAVTAVACAGDRVLVTALDRRARLFGPDGPDRSDEAARHVRRRGRRGRRGVGGRRPPRGHVRARRRSARRPGRRRGRRRRVHAGRRRARGRRRRAGGGRVRGPHGRVGGAVARRHGAGGRRAARPRRVGASTSRSRPRATSSRRRRSTARRGCGRATGGPWPCSRATRRRWRRCGGRRTGGGSLPSAPIRRRAGVDATHGRRDDRWRRRARADGHVHPRRGGDRRDVARRTGPRVLHPTAAPWDGSRPPGAPALEVAPSPDGGAGRVGGRRPAGARHHDRAGRAPRGGAPRGRARAVRRRTRRRERADRAVARDGGRAGLAADAAVRRDRRPRGPAPSRGVRRRGAVRGVPPRGLRGVRRASAHATTTALAGDGSVPTVGPEAGVEHPPGATTFRRDGPPRRDDGRRGRRAARLRAHAHEVGARRIRMLVATLPDGRTQVLPSMCELPDGPWFDYTHLLFGAPGLDRAIAAGRGARRPVVLDGARARVRRAVRGLPRQRPRAARHGAGRDRDRARRGARSAWTARRATARGACTPRRGTGSRRARRSRGSRRFTARGRWRRARSATSRASGSRRTASWARTSSSTSSRRCCSTPSAWTRTAAHSSWSTTGCRSARAAAREAGGPHLRALSRAARQPAAVAAAAGVRRTRGMRRVPRRRRPRRRGPRAPPRGPARARDCVACHLPFLEIERGHGRVADHTIGVPHPGLPGDRVAKDACSTCHAAGSATTGVPALDGEALRAAYARVVAPRGAAPVAGGGRVGPPRDGGGRRAPRRRGGRPRGAAPRARVGDALLDRSGEAARAPLLRASHDPDTLVRRAALAALAAFRGPDVDAQLLAGLDDPSRAVRTAAARATLAGWERAAGRSRRCSRAALPVLEADAASVPDDDQRWFRLGAARNSRATSRARSTPTRGRWRSTRSRRTCGRTSRACARAGDPAEVTARPARDRGAACRRVRARPATPWSGSADVGPRARARGHFGGGPSFAGAAAVAGDTTTRSDRSFVAWRANPSRTSFAVTAW